MGADYNIYIHSDPTAEGSKTSPFTFSGRSNTQPKDSESGGADVSSYINAAANPDSLVQKGVGTIAKAFPYVAVAMAVIKIADKGATTVMTINATNTGDFSTINRYNNFKATLRFTMSPFSSQTNYLQNISQGAIKDIRNRMNQTLLGDSVINSRVTGRTV